MGLDFAILFALFLAFWWFAGKVIDDTLDCANTDAAWWRALAHEDIARDYEDRDAA